MKKVVGFDVCEAEKGFIENVGHNMFSGQRAPVAVNRKAVTVIPATLNLFTSTPKILPNNRKVAAYARVSTDKEEQILSYEAQVDYYTRYIKSREDWEFVEVYTDEGISATNTKKRDGFKRMVKDALDGKIDLIVTKSVSRFARNTVDTLTTVRKLKEHGVEVYFEKENIYTFDSKGELLITIMSSLAQEESRSISENTTWGQRKRFADGKISLPYKQFLGYEKGENDIPKVVEKEAKLVRLIYRMFLEGKTPNGIARFLTDQKIPTPGGKERWRGHTVKSILTNEKYKGDALLQKCYTVDFLTKKRKKNEGEVPQYYVENSHEAIISPEVFDLVQYEFEKRKGRVQSGAGCFSSKIVCGECGSFFGPKVWHSTDKYRRVIWRCNARFKNKEKCKTPHLAEDQIKEAFIRAANDLIENKENIIEECEALLVELTDTASIENKEIKLKGEKEALYNSLKELIETNSRSDLNQEEYNARYGVLREQYEKIKDKLSKLEALKFELRAKSHKVKEFIGNLEKSSELLTDFDEQLWYALVEKATVNSDGNIKFEFKKGKPQMSLTN